MTPARATSVTDALSSRLNPLAQSLAHRYRLWQNDIRYDKHVSIPVPGRPPLQASLYLPNQNSRPGRINPALATILVMLPYGRHQYGEALAAGVNFGAAGFAVLTLDLRGYESDSLPGMPTRAVPWAGVQQDAVAALDWIIGQAWSNGRVGTFGCSALGETQFALAKANHPAHRAMLVSGAGGAMGDLAGRYGYFGLFEGGILQLASAYGWLARRGWLSPPFVRAAYPEPDQAQAVLQSLARLPVTNLISSADNAWRFITGTALDDPAWRQLNYVHADDEITVPTLTINTWGDQTLSESILLHDHIDAPGKRLILAPGDHCSHEQTPPPGSADWQTVYNQWFDHWLRTSPDQTDHRARNRNALPAISFRLPDDARWRHSAQWPPQSARTTQWRLHSATSAKSIAGDGRLSLPGGKPVESTPYSQWRADPGDPVPSIGGPVCCTSTSTITSGRQDQQPVERRNDVLVFTSEPFAAVTAFAGPVRASLYLSSDAPDADLIVRVTDVAPDGRSVNIQEGAQRVSMTSPQASARLAAGEVVPVTVSVRELAHRFVPGHRLRVHVAASSFPRLARNLQTAGVNRENTQWVVAQHRLHHSSRHPSNITLTQLTDTDTDK